MLLEHEVKASGTSDPDVDVHDGVLWMREGAWLFRVFVRVSAAGLGVAFVSRVSVRAHLAAGLVRLVPGLDLVVRRTFHWALPAGVLTGTAAQFHAFARRSALG